MDWTPTTLVLGPGGVKGFLEIGALEALAFFLVLRGVRRFVGVSVGAVLALLLAAGFAPQELTEMALKLDLVDQVFAVKPLKAATFLAKGGLFSPDKIEAYLARLLRTKFPCLPTLGQLRDFTGAELEVVATNVSACEPAYLSWRTAPDLGCIEAVLMSISIPLVFEYRELAGQHYADGGLSDPLPVQLHADEDQLALRIVDSAGAADGLLGYVYAAFSVPMEYMIKDKLRRLSRRAAFRRRCRVLELTTSSFNPVNPAMSEAEKLGMINQGRKIAIEFIIRCVSSAELHGATAVQAQAEQSQHPRRDVRRRLPAVPELQEEPAAGAGRHDVPPGRRHAGQKCPAPERRLPRGLPGGPRQARHELPFVCRVQPAGLGSCEGGQELSPERRHLQRPHGAPGARR